MNLHQSDLTKEELLFNVSYDTLVLMMELLDGYRNMNLELSDKESKEVLNKNIQLHDGLVDFLKSFQFGCKENCIFHNYIHVMYVEF